MTTASDASWSDTELHALVGVLLGSGEVGVMLLAPDGRVRRWSEGACKILGYTAGEIIGTPFEQLFTPEDRARGAHALELHSACEVGSSQDDRWHVRKDGARVWTTGVTVPWRGDAGPGPATGHRPDGFVKIVRDATHLRTRIGYLENEVREGAMRHKQMTFFIGSTAHELRNPLAPLKGSHYLLKSMAGDAPELQRPLAVIERQIGALERLVEDLADLTRADAGTLSLAYDRVNLQRLLSDAQEVCAPAAAMREIDIQLIAPDEPVQAEVDPDRIRQVVVNLLNNAIKFSDRGGRVWLKLTPEDDRVLFTVRDAGCGIGPELLPRVFDAFTRASADEAPRGGGMGLGLAVVKEIVNAHMGTVEVRSDGHSLGSEFIVRLPLHRPRA